MISRRTRFRRLATAVAMLACACATDHGTFVRQNGAAPEPKVLEADAHECDKVRPSIFTYLGGALAGAGAGVVVGVAGFGGGSGGGSSGALQIAGGAALGALVGLVVGAIAAEPGDNYDLCMARKGYQRVDEHQTAPQTAPVSAPPAQPQ